MNAAIIAGLRDRVAVRGSRSLHEHGWIGRQIPVGQAFQLDHATASICLSKNARLPGKRGGAGSASERWTNRSGLGRPLPCEFSGERPMINGQGKLISQAPSLRNENSRVFECWVAVSRRLREDKPRGGRRKGEAFTDTHLPRCRNTLTPSRSRSQ